MVRCELHVPHPRRTGARGLAANVSHAGGSRKASVAGPGFPRRGVAEVESARIAAGTGPVGRRGRPWSPARRWRVL